jgi:hypothetical protein
MRWHARPLAMTAILATTTAQRHGVPGGQCSPAARPALGAIGFETLANTSQARAADSSSSNASLNTTTVVTKVAAGDGSITVSGTIARPKIKTGSLDEIAKLHPPAAAVNFNDQNGINVANGGPRPT